MRIHQKLSNPIASTSSPGSTRNHLLGYLIGKKKKKMNLSAEKLALLERAIADPASITPAEKNDILWLPPPDMENQLHQSTFHLSSCDALGTKALENDDAEPSYDEARWLEKLGHKNPFEKVGIDGSLNRLERPPQGPIVDRALVADAKSAVLTLDEERARTQAGQGETASRRGEAREGPGAAQTAGGQMGPGDRGCRAPALGFCQFADRV